MLTISKNNHFEITEKKSSFICYLFKITNEEEALSYINSLKKEHHKARHHCYAFILNNNIKRSSDDGEPSGTAGVPILETLENFNLENTLAIVVRYFGGIKLGAGGLIRAYVNATKNAILNTGITEVVQKKLVILTTDYSLNDKFKYFLDQNEIHINNINYDEKVHFEIIIDDLNNFIQNLDKIYFNKYEIKDLGHQTVEIPLS